MYLEVKYRKKMKKSTSISIIFMLFIFFGSYAQEEDSIKLHLTIREMHTGKNFMRNYNRELARVRRVYPMALKAKALISEYEKDLAEIDKNRKQKKYGKDAHKELKDQFTYSIRDLYTSEGKLLMELVHRETGMTVNEIIRKFRGGIQATLYEGMGNLFDQNLDAKYDAEGDNWITEIVIQDILNGDVEFDPEMDKLTKDEFKKTQAEYKVRKKESHKLTRKMVRENKIKEREAKKESRKQKKTH